jgi:hypothetical protein
LISEQEIHASGFGGLASLVATETNRAGAGDQHHCIGITGAIGESNDAVVVDLKILNNVLGQSTLKKLSRPFLLGISIQARKTHNNARKFNLRKLFFVPVLIGKNRLKRLSNSLQ